MTQVVDEDLVEDSAQAQQDFIEKMKANWAVESRKLITNAVNDITRLMSEQVPHEVQLEMSKHRMRVFVSLISGMNIDDVPDSATTSFEEAAKYAKDPVHYAWGVRALAETAIQQNSLNLLLLLPLLLSLDVMQLVEAAAYESFKQNPPKLDPNVESVLAAFRASVHIASDTVH